MTITRYTDFLPVVVRDLVINAAKDPVKIGFGRMRLQQVARSVSTNAIDGCVHHTWSDVRSWL